MSTLSITLWLWPLRVRTCFIAKMTLNPEELKILLCSSWRTEFKNWSRSDLLRYRQLRLRAMDGREMPFFYLWPTEMRRILFKNHSPPSDRETMHLFVFLVGNGLSAYRSGTWIITMHALRPWWRRDALVRKRIAQICWIYKNIRDNNFNFHYHNVLEGRIQGVNDM